MALRDPPSSEKAIKKGDGGSQMETGWQRGELQQEARQESPPGVFYWGCLKNPDGKEPGFVSSLSGAVVSVRLPQAT